MNLLLSVLGLGQGPLLLGLGQIPGQGHILRFCSKKTLFLVALATTRRLGDLQAVPSVIATNQDYFILSYIPGFLAKTETSYHRFVEFSG